MKFQFIYILIASFIYISKCYELVAQTNYTLTYFKKLDGLTLNCNTDSDCPQYSKCGSRVIKGKAHSLCLFDTFLCPGRVDDMFSRAGKEEGGCIYVNTEIWDMENEEIREKYDKKMKPILKTCLKRKTGKDYFGLGCVTEHCDSNEDCFSGMCYGGYCVNNEKMDHEIFRCSQDITDDYYHMKCGKVNLMECGSDDECYSGICRKSKGVKSCTEKEDLKTMITIILKLVFGIFIFILITFGTIELFIRLF